MSQVTLLAVGTEDNHDLVAVDAMFFSTVAGLRSDGRRSVSRCSTSAAVMCARCGADTEGRAMPSGVYLVEARAPGEVWAMDKIMLLR